MVSMLEAVSVTGAAMERPRAEIAFAYSWGDLSRKPWRICVMFEMIFWMEARRAVRSALFVSSVVTSSSVIWPPRTFTR